VPSCLLWCSLQLSRCIPLPQPCAVQPVMMTYRGWWAACGVRFTIALGPRLRLLQCTVRSAWAWRGAGAPIKFHEFFIILSNAKRDDGIFGCGDGSSIGTALLFRANMRAHQRFFMKLKCILVTASGYERLATEPAHGIVVSRPAPAQKLRDRALVFT